MVRALQHGTIHAYDMELAAIKQGSRKETCDLCKEAKRQHTKRSAFVNQLLLARFIRAYPELAKQWRAELRKQAIEQFPEPGASNVSGNTTRHDDRSSTST